MQIYIYIHIHIVFPYHNVCICIYIYMYIFTLSCGLGLFLLLDFASRALVLDRPCDVQRALCDMITYPRGSGTYFLGIRSPKP